MALGSYRQNGPKATVNGRDAYQGAQVDGVKLDNLGNSSNAESGSRKRGLDGGQKLIDRDRLAEVTMHA